MGEKRGRDDGRVRLETPFSSHTLPEVVFLLRFVYHGATADQLEAVEPHAAGIIRLAHALDLGGLQPGLGSAVSAFLTKKLVTVPQNTLEGRSTLMSWLGVAEGWGQQLEWAQGIR